MKKQIQTFAVNEVEATKAEQTETTAERMVYQADEIKTILGLGRSKTYEYLEEVYQKQEPFRVIKVGRLFRVPKHSFDEWIKAV